MADVPQEKTMTTSNVAGSESPSVGEQEISAQRKGKPWMYKKPLGFLPAYATPKFQVFFVAMVCFLCPGMFNAVNGLGAGGQLTAKDTNHANTAVYATFSVIGFFAGSIANRIGLRLTLGIGGFGYMLYIASLLSYNHDKNAGFLIFAGALLGFCAGLLWTAEGAVMLSYPLEKDKGRYIAWFWAIFNLGGVIGALVPLAQNIHSHANSVGDGTYIAFIILMACGFILAAFLCNPKFVEREDGSHVILMKNPSWKSEIFGLLEVLKTDWYIIFLFPLFLSSNWFYTYHFNDVNLARFNIRTRSLNNVLYWSSQIIGALVMGYSLDSKLARRSTRARMGLGALFVLTMVIWGGGYDFQKQYTRVEVNATDYVKLDWTSHGYGGPLVLYMFYGFFDAAWQTTTYWFLGGLTNNSRKLACFVGFYKGIQSAGGAIAPAIDTTTMPYMTEFAANWGLLAGSLLIAAPVIWLKIKDTVTVEEDLKFSDETMADVVPSSAWTGAEGHVGEEKHAL